MRDLLIINKSLADGTPMVSARLVGRANTGLKACMTESIQAAKKRIL